MSDEETKIESMVQQGKLSRTDADNLLAALREQEQPTDAPEPERETARPGHRFLRVRVDEAGRETVNIRFPIALANIGLKILEHQGTVDLRADGRPIPVDMERIRSLIADPSFCGELLDVHTDDDTRVLLVIE